jgi:hypothetical protein
MNSIEITIFSVVLIVGLYLLSKARAYGKQQKKQYQAEALCRLGEILENVPVNEYRIYKLGSSLLNQRSVKVSSVREMKQSILFNCIKSTGGNGEIYGPSLFSIEVDAVNKKILYFVGSDVFDFTELVS